MNHSMTMNDVLSHSNDVSEMTDEELAEIQGGVGPVAIIIAFAVARIILTYAKDAY